MYRLFIDFKKACDSVRREVLYHLIEFDISMKLVRLIMCLNETCNRIRVGKHLSDMFRNWFETGRCFIVIAFQLCFRLCIRRVQVNQDGLKLNGTHQLLVYADNVNILDGSVHTVKKKQAL